MLRGMTTWKPSPSMLMSLFAVFVALGGAAYAAGLKKNSVGSKQVKNNSLTGADVNEAKLTLPPGPQGPTGPQGAQGSPDTPQQVLDKLLTVDGSGSTLDADTLDGQGANGFLGATAAAGGDLTGNYPNPQIAPGSIGADELPGFNLFQMGEASLNDTVGGGATEALLIDLPSFEIIGRCTENPAGTFAASIEFRSAGGTAFTSAVDSTMPGGVNDSPALAHGAEATLAAQSASTAAHVLTGQFGILRFNTSTQAQGLEILGTGTLATNFGAPDCRFKVSIVG
jgi:hypothetical protein